ncbi:MAG: preprotein translocase subunit SecA [Candidatus Sericytochromatia bacterium]|nr:preprotein translocase subunit SecA [Candidatus Sericytochromatia bacterium]
MLQLLAKIFGDANERKVRAVRPLVMRINQLEPQWQILSDDELRAKTDEFRARHARGESLDSLLPEAFATVREAGRRVLGMRHFDVQLIGGIFLHKGQIAEMRTGEGKTLVATLPCYLNALTGKGVHVVTVNDYLARRDSEWMGQIYRFLGLSVGLIQNHLSPMQRRAAYQSDITYATNNELGFDYLRDNMARELDACVQRPLNFAIVDEVDSILIDEARTPLIISGPIAQKQDQYVILARAVPRLIRDVHYTVDEKAKNIILTEDGITEAERILGVEQLYDPANPSLAHDMVQALRAKELYRRDIEYVVKHNPELGFEEVVIVDEFTGRLMVGRRYSDGLHQAIEAKESVRIQDETQTLATITFQNYFRLYEKLAGMTGTAATEEAEFGKIYNLEVTVIPTNRSVQRRDMADVVYKNGKIKFEMIADEIARIHEEGRPILVGTVSIERSEALSGLLKQRGLPHRVLNAKYHEEEARIVAQAGRYKAITIATNMAGRGTDIILGGNPESLLTDLIREAGHEDPGVVPEAELARLREQAYATCAAEKERVLALGGLHIIGTERHESRRIDNQLRGRAGRQGDPGSTRFYLALDDDLMRLFNGDKVAAIFDRLNVPDDEAIEHPMVTRSIEGAQRKVEIYHFNSRKQVLEYDDVMNQQRSIIYAERRKVLEGREFSGNLKTFIHRVVHQLVDQYVNSALHRDEWDLKGLHEAVSSLAPFLSQPPAATQPPRFSWAAAVATTAPASRQLTRDELEGRSVEDLRAHLQARVQEAYEIRESTMGIETLQQLARQLMLQLVDRRWIQHLHDMEALREGIGFRAYGQKDPLQEYKREAYEHFQDLVRTIQFELVQQLFHVQLLYDVPGSFVPPTDDMFEIEDDSASPTA